VLLKPDLSPYEAPAIGTHVQYAGKDWVVSEEPIGGTPEQQRGLVLLERRHDRLPGFFTTVCVHVDALRPRDLFDELADESGD
jgi:hypothetical protein